MCRAGKTLVGIQLVYENHLEGSNIQNTAVFLSGNGPLVKVLQHALKYKIFVQDVHGFLKEYGGETAKIPMNTSGSMMKLNGLGMPSG